MKNKYEQSIINLRKEFHKTRLAENISVNPTDLYNVIYPYGDELGTVIKHYFVSSKYKTALYTLGYYLQLPVPYDRSQKEHWDFAFRKALDEFSK